MVVKDVKTKNSLWHFPDASRFGGNMPSSMTSIPFMFSSIPFMFSSLIPGMWKEQTQEKFWSTGALVGLHVFSLLGRAMDIMLHNNHRFLPAVLLYNKLNISPNLQKLRNQIKESRGVCFNVSQTLFLWDSTGDDIRHICFPSSDSVCFWSSAACYTLE